MFGLLSKPECTLIISGGKMRGELEGMRGETSVILALMQKCKSRKISQCINAKSYSSLFYSL